MEGGTTGITINHLDVPLADGIRSRAESGGSDIGGIRSRTRSAGRMGIRAPADWDRQRYRTIDRIKGVGCLQTKFDS